MITCKEVRRRLCYDAKRGIFWLRKGTSGHAAGSYCGILRKDSYRYIKLNQYEYLEHRLAWLYIKGYFPETDIDHENRKKWDNRFKNLREASRSCNMRNTPNRKDNKSGIKGVSWCKTRQGWVATIFGNGKLVNLGRFQSKIEAACHRLAAEQCLGWAGCDSTSPAYLFVKRYTNQRSFQIQ